jgi:hypothetical protein
MTAPFTKVAILITGTALLCNSLRDTHTRADSVYRDSVFVYDTRKFQILCTGTEFVFNYSAGRTELQIICTETAFSFTSLRDCIRFECACAVCFLLIICATHRKVQILCTGTADCARESA